MTQSAGQSQQLVVEQLPGSGCRPVEKSLTQSGRTSSLDVLAGCWLLKGKEEVGPSHGPTAELM